MTAEGMAKADDISEMGLCLQSDMDKTIKQNFELKAAIFGGNYERN